MKLATWNVNGMKARLEFIKLWLEDRAPDVVGLQELKLTDETFPHDLFADLGYRALTHGQKSWNGVAVLSKLPMEAVQVGLPGQEAFGARLITVQIDDGSATGMQFTTVYCPNGKTLEHDDYPAKLAWFDSLAEHLAGSLAPASIVCGDFNIVPEAIDSWMGADGEGRLFHTEAERSRLARIGALGLADLYRSLHPDEQTFSWWDYRGGAFHRKQGLRIDLMLGTGPVAERLTGAGTDRDYRKKQAGLTASDHAPVIVELAD
jgi:exodeoxyribonuclease-3